MESDSKKEKQITQDEGSEPHPGNVLSPAGLRRALSISYRDYRELLVSRPGVLLCIRVILASLLVFR